MPSRLRCLGPSYAVSPAKGQTFRQLDNDEFDCNSQAQERTGYNPDFACLETRGYTLTK